MQKLYIDKHRGFMMFGNDELPWAGVYAHGDLEEKAGYDIVCYSEQDGFDFKTDRIEDVITVLTDGTEIKSRLFYWVAYIDDHHARARGLVVSVDDAHSLKYAERKYNEKSERL